MTNLGCSISVSDADMATAAVLIWIIGRWRGGSYAKGLTFGPTRLDDAKALTDLQFNVFISIDWNVFLKRQKIKACF